MKHLRTLSLAALFALTALALVPSSSHAEKLAAPEGRVILTVDGAIGRTTDGAQALFDRKLIMAIGRRELKTSNPFVKGVHRFEGVLLSELLDHVGAKGTTLSAVALDGYTVNIPIEDARKYPVLIATHRDGKVMRVRDKGPLWVIYPVDQYAELKVEAFSNRSIWQLKHLTVK